MVPHRLSRSAATLICVALASSAAAGFAASRQSASPGKSLTSRAQKSAKKAPEVYTAEEPGVTSYAIPDDENLPPQPVAPRTTARVQQASSDEFPPPPPPAPAVTKAQVPTQAQTSVRKSSATVKSVPFDPVPSNQIDSIAKRLALVEKILRKHGRAYDYRTLTIRTLEETLAQLDQSASMFDTTPPSQAPVPATNPTEAQDDLGSPAPASEATETAGL